MQLPDYVGPTHPVLHKKSEHIETPFSAENKHYIDILSAKFDSEENCAGLAAPQIGIDRSIIVFKVEADEEIKKWRPSLTDEMPKTIWINPKYEAIGTETSEDWEACFSVPNMCGLVPRFNTVSYSALNQNGEKVTGIAHGFLARVIQHEIDHVNGRLYTEIAIRTLDREAYITMRKKAMESTDSSAEISQE